MTDGLQHNLSLYCVDYDNRNRSESIQIINPSTARS